MNDGVCAVVVTYHPSQVDIDNLAFIREQVQHLVVVDNGSDENQLTNIRLACQAPNIHLIENGANLGIAAALNTGIQWAISQGCKWVVLFDQDSKPSGGFVETLLSSLLNHPQTQRIAIMVSSSVDARSNLVSKPPAVFYTPDGELLVAQTSGSLMPTSVFQKEGWFDEKFFVDYVDYDYCLMVRIHGWIIEKCTDAVLLHKPGDPGDYRVFGVRLFGTTNYSAARRYYRTRNVLWMLRKYWKTNLRLCLTMNWWNLKDVVKIAGEVNPWNKWRAAFRGFVDGFFRNPGDTPNATRAVQN
jgi:rhamnosyltransferase